MTDPSASGSGRNKDDFCDCIPFTYHGRRWMLGEVRGGKVFTGTPQNRDRGVWVEVDATGRALFVPGFGVVGEAGGGAPGGGGGAPNVGELDFPTADGALGFLAIAAVFGGIYVAARMRGGKR
jgi:hypothetical protein